MKKYLPLQLQTTPKGLPIGSEREKESSLKILETALSKVNLLTEK
jgi:hypothetical protein